jgi:probable phosphomutase (TIGR03848 family)
MPTVFLIRHGRTTANTAGILAGWKRGVHLDSTGERQATKVGRSLRGLDLEGMVTSPLHRTKATADRINAERDDPLPIRVDKDFGECAYGEWTGRRLSDLAKEPLWEVVQQHPSAAVFPGGEGLLAMQARAVDAIRRWNVKYPVGYAVVSHGDVIKAILADALGLHLDHFQRIAVDPGSISIVTYTPRRPFVQKMNITSGPLHRYLQRPATSDAPVGGGAG